MASISAPVLAVTTTWLRISTPSGIGWMSTSTCSRKSGCASGISSDVFLAAWMPARRATAKASPLGRLASRIRVWADSRTRQEASATRRVTGFSDTSTMWAEPWGSRWLKEPCELMASPAERIRRHASISPILSPMRLAIVVPTLNEEDTLRRHLPAALAAADEVVVSDGGSTDATVEVARSLGAHVVTGPPGRGAQLNRGAAEATADILLFLHADTT